MARLQKCVALFLAVLLFFSLCGCWNYRLLEDLAIVAGACIDKGENGEFELTIEIAEARSGKERNVDSRIIQASGETIFDAVRDAIAITGKKLYWSHTKVIVVSEEIARDEMINISDWLSRDAETRNDIELYVAKGIPAKDILLVDNPTGNILSYILESIIYNELSLSKARRTQTWKFTNDVTLPGLSPQIPAVTLFDNHDEKIPRVEGSALFQHANLKGFINGDDTKNLLFVLDKIEGGLLVFPITFQGNELKVSLEIFQSKTKLKAVWNNDVPEFEINIRTVVSIDELHGAPGDINGELITALETSAQEYIKQNIEKTIHFILNEYGCDSFGFGYYIYRTEPQKWKKIDPDWEKILPTLKTTVNANVVIKNSATREKTVSKDGGK